MSERKPLDKIRSGVLDRGLAFARVSLGVGARAATHAVSHLLSSEKERAEGFKDLLLKQAQTLAHELGQLKGTAMKVGQMLSMYGEAFLPPEVNNVLKTLRSQSPPLAWRRIEQELITALGQDRLAELQIDETPLAAASIGQVHRAVVHATGQELALKIQYPGVSQAVDSDLKTLRSILTMSRLVPKGPKFQELFDEVREMLHQEMDFNAELKATREFAERLKDCKEYVVPRPEDRYSARTVLATQLIAGVELDGPEVKALNRERRSRIARLGLSLYFKELFEFGAVQTDPHFGNYKVQLGAPEIENEVKRDAENPAEKDRLVLLDFGAVRWFKPEFLIPYRKMVAGAYWQRRDLLEEGGRELGFLRAEDSEDQLKLFREVCYLVSEPFLNPDETGVCRDFFVKNAEGEWEYDFAASDLPTRVAKMLTQFAVVFRLRTPPREIVFLDRKLGGVFMFLSSLGARFNARKVLEPWVSSKTGPTGLQSA